MDTGITVSLVIGVYSNSIKISVGYQIFACLIVSNCSNGVLVLCWRFELQRSYALCLLTVSNIAMESHRHCLLPYLYCTHLSPSLPPLSPYAHSHASSRMHICLLMLTYSLSPSLSPSLSLFLSFFLSLPLTGVLEIVLIGTVPLVIVIVTVLILICITYR